MPLLGVLFLRNSTRRALGLVAGFKIGTFSFLVTSKCGVLWVVLSFLDSLLSSDSEKLLSSGVVVVAFWVGAFAVVIGAAVLVPNFVFGALGVPLYVLDVEEGAGVVVEVVDWVVVVVGGVVVGVEVGGIVVVVGSAVVVGAFTVFGMSAPISDRLSTRAALTIV